MTSSVKRHANPCIRRHAGEAYYAPTSAVLKVASGGASRHAPIRSACGAGRCVARHGALGSQQLKAHHGWDSHRPGLLPLAYYNPAMVSPNIIQEPGSPRDPWRR
jgi:hypothetical protein